MSNLEIIYRERLGLLDRQRAQEDARHAAAIEQLETNRSIVLKQIELEKQFTAATEGGASLKTAVAPLRPGVQNAQENEILNVLSDNHEWEHSAIKAHLIRAGFGTPDDPQFGRVLQGVLLSMRKRELIELVGGGNGVWKISSKPPHKEETAGAASDTGGPTLPTITWRP